MSNSTNYLEIQTSFESTHLAFDFPALHIGVAEYSAGPTGVTVFYFPKKVRAAVDVRGGAPGTMNTDALRLGYEEPMMDAVVFAGGSWYGLAAAGGVSDALKSLWAKSGEWGNIAGVVAGIIFDMGRRRLNTITPDANLGRAALQAARPGQFPLGARGAGRFAMHGWYFGQGQLSGQGGAFQQVGPTKIAVFTVVNALGTIVDRDGHIVRCSNGDHPADCGTIADRLNSESRRITKASNPPSNDAAGPTENTTLTLVVTNQKMPYWALQRLAVQVHTSMARAIQPFSTSDDGDVLYAVSTDEIENEQLNAMDLGVIASEVAWDAVLNSVPELDPDMPSDPIHLEESTLTACTGLYEFSPGARVAIEQKGLRLMAEAKGMAGNYFLDDKAVELLPIRGLDFAIQAPWGGSVRFMLEDDQVIGFILNPGHWSQKARRIS